MNYQTRDGGWAARRRFWPPFLHVYYRRAGGDRRRYEEVMAVLLDGSWLTHREIQQRVAVPRDGDLNTTINRLLGAGLIQVRRAPRPGNPNEFHRNWR